MSYTYRNRRVAYDNIAVGSATGQERTIAGAVAKEPGTSPVGGGEGLTVGNAAGLEVRHDANGSVTADLTSVFLEVV